MSDSSERPRPREVRFSVASISCVACTPAFKKGLMRTEGINEVKQLPMLNKVVVEYDPERASEVEVERRIFEVADRVGFKGKVHISRRG